MQSEKNKNNELIEDATLIDTSLIDYMLSLTYEERLELNDSAIELVEELKAAGKQLYAKKLEGNS